MRPLISRPNVERLAITADMDLRVSHHGTRDLIDNLMNNGLRQRTKTISMSFLPPSDPEKAKNVVQSLLTIFVESSLGDKRPIPAAR
jgi:hypothetical protein